MTTTRTAILTALALIVAATAWADHHHKSEHKSSNLPRTAAPKGAELYFVSPKNGATLYSPVTVRFGLRGMGVAPAGVDKANTGHHHLIIDAPLPRVDLPVPNDDHHRHFGGGQTEVTIELPPGKHTLQLLLGDKMHVPHRPPVISEKITVTVK